MADLSVGTRIKVFIPLNRERSKIIMLPAILKSYIDNNRLVIIVPIKSHTSYPIDVNHKVIIECYEKNIAFEATIIQKNNLGTWSYFLLEQNSDYRHIQYRQDFRLDCKLDGYIEFKDLKCGGVKTFNITTHDVSGGGTCIYSPVDLNAGESINVYLPLGYNDEFIFFPSKVRRCIYIENSITLRYVVGLQFLFENTKQKDRLIAQIFKMQRERRKLS